MNTAIDNAIKQIISNFGAEDAASNKAFEDGLRSAMMTFIAPLFAAKPVVIQQIAPAAVPVAVKAKRATSNWQRFQKAWNVELKRKNEAAKAAGQPLVTFADVGSRTKACAAAYGPLKDKPVELQAYLDVNV